MTIIVLLLLFKDICQYLQNIVLKCYNKLVKPNYKLSSSSSQKNYSTSSTSHHHHQNRNYRSVMSTSTNASLYKTRVAFEQVSIRRGSEVRGARKIRKIRG